MSTRATITVEKDGLFHTIYNHFDGYLSGLGKLLYENYNSHNLACQIVSFGDVSSVNESVDDNEYYHRNRNDNWDDVKPRISNDIMELEVKLKSFGVSYDYVFKDNQWFWRLRYSSTTFKPLAEAAFNKFEEDYDE